MENVFFYHNSVGEFELQKQTDVGLLIKLSCTEIKCILKITHAVGNVVFNII